MSILFAVLCCLGVFTGLTICCLFADIPAVSFFFRVLEVFLWGLTGVIYSEFTTSVIYTLAFATCILGGVRLIPMLVVTLLLIRMWNTVFGPFYEGEDS